MSNDNTQQISPQGDNGKNEDGGLLASASDFARSVLDSIQALAGTTACKSVQQVRLKQWVQEQGRWFEDLTQVPEGRKHTIAYRREQVRNKLTYDEP